MAETGLPTNDYSVNYAFRPPTNSPWVRAMKITQTGDLNQKRWWVRKDLNFRPADFESECLDGAMANASISVFYSFVGAT